MHVHIFRNWGIKIIQLLRSSQKLWIHGQITVQPSVLCPDWGFSVWIRLRCGHPAFPPTLGCFHYLGVLLPVTPSNGSTHLHKHNWHNLDFLEPNVWTLNRPERSQRIVLASFAKKSVIDCIYSVICCNSWYTSPIIAVIRLVTNTTIQCKKSFKLSNISFCLKVDLPIWAPTKLKPVLNLTNHITTNCIILYVKDAVYPWS